MNSLQLLKIAIASALVLSSSAPRAENPPAVEKCFGIAKAGKNDCQTASSACAGTSKQDRQPDAWIYLPKGSCERISGGSVKPKDSAAG